MIGGSARSGLARAALLGALAVGCPRTPAEDPSTAAAPAPPPKEAPAPTADAPPAFRGPFNPEEAFSKPNDAFSGGAPPGQPAVKRGGSYASFVERFNRHYTDPGYRPAKTVYVSPTGGGDGSSARAPANPKAALADVSPGTRIVFTKGDYAGCFEIAPEKSGTYDAPIVLYGERNADGSRGVKMSCCASGRETCFNFEGTSYVAVDGFELHGGKYGVRAIGEDHAATKHSRGIAVLNSNIDKQSHDSVVTSSADWMVIENVIASNNGKGDGHGIYVSNGSDWNIVRGNDLWNNNGASLQINADPLSTCDYPYASEDCDAIAGTGDGGKGAADFMLVENNYIHHGKQQGSNFTSMRYSMVRNNVFASWGRHGVSFWSETADPAEKESFNPKLGSHHNRVHHNLFSATNDKLMVQFIANSTSNDIRNNLFVGFTVSGKKVRARPSATWIEVDETVKANVYENNMYIAGRFEGRTAGKSEKTRQDLDLKWFARLPTGLPSTVSDFRPQPGAPFLDRAPALPSVAFDRDGKPRASPADIGPFEL